MKLNALITAAMALWSALAALVAVMMAKGAMAL